MKKLSIFSLILTIIFPIFPANALSIIAPTEVTIVVNADPCSRNAALCILPWIVPESSIEIMRLDDGTSDLLEFPLDDPTAPLRVITEVVIDLFPGEHLFIVENFLNGQLTTFGPINIPHNAAAMDLRINMYSSWGDSAPLLPKEMCLSTEITALANPHSFPPDTMTIFCHEESAAIVN